MYQPSTVAMKLVITVTMSSTALVYPTRICCHPVTLWKILGWIQGLHALISTEPWMFPLREASRSFLREAWLSIPPNCAHRSINNGAASSIWQRTPVSEYQRGLNRPSQFCFLSPSPLLHSMIRVLAGFCAWPPAFVQLCASFTSQL